DRPRHLPLDGLDRNEKPLLEGESHGVLLQRQVLHRDGAGGVQGRLVEGRERLLEIVEGGKGRRRKREEGQCQSEQWKAGLLHRALQVWEYAPECYTSPGSGRKAV